jgi:hypothetical protein
MAVIGQPDSDGNFKLHSSKAVEHLVDIDILLLFVLDLEKDAVHFFGWTESLFQPPFVLMKVGDSFILEMSCINRDPESLKKRISR